MSFHILHNFLSRLKTEQVFELREMNTQVDALYDSLSNLIKSKCNEWKLTVCEYYNNDDVIDIMIAQVQKYQNLLSAFSDVVKIDRSICSIDKVFLLSSIAELNDKCEATLEGK